MNLIKKSFLYIFIILLLVSIYKDLYYGTIINNQTNDDNSAYTTVNKPHVIKVKVQQGDTVLSIVEKINETENENLNIEMILEDFQAANPTADPFQLKANAFYYFPLYEKEAE